MPEMVVLLIQSAPGLGAAVLIVWLHQRNIREIAKRCHESQDRASDAIEENSKILGSTGEIVRDSSVVMREVRDFLIKVNGKIPR